MGESGVSHAFGGALALAFHVGGPRATRDIDVNVFLPSINVDQVEQALTKRAAFSDEQRDAARADHLAVFKVFYNRTKDWADIEEMVFVGSLDHPRVAGWLAGLLGIDDERVHKFLALTS